MREARNALLCVFCVSVVKFLSRHCEERSDEAVQWLKRLDCFGFAKLSLAMTPDNRYNGGHHLV